MPGLGGLELLASLRDKQSLIPVVVMSGVGNEEAAVEALQAGASSYIPKSNLSELLVPTLETVLELAATHSNRRRMIDCLKSMDLRFEFDNEDSLVSPLVRYLEDHIGSLRLCGEPELVRIGVGLHESLTNAMHHGNLEFDSELRQEDESLYHEMREARKLIWPYCDRKVHVFASLNIERLRFVIRDEGPGFNHKKMFDPTAAENLERIGGRGLLLIRSFMDEVSYNDRGNEIALLKYTTAGRKLLAKLIENTPESSAEDLKSQRKRSCSTTIRPRICKPFEASREPPTPARRASEWFVSNNHSLARRAGVALRIIRIRSRRSWARAGTEYSRECCPDR